MNHRRLLIVFSAGLAVATTTLAFGSFLAGCADYHSDPGANAAGTGGTGATPSAGGAPATGGAPGTGGQGTGGGAGLPATGGGAGTGQAGASTGGSAGAASGGAGAGGSAGGSAGSASGSAGAGPACDNPMNVTACGGDVAGTWMVMSSCIKVSGAIDLTGLGADCKSGEITSGTLSVTGTFTATSDGTFTDGTQTTGDEILELPQTCKTLSGTETTCKRVGGPLRSIGFDSATCVDNTTTMGCTCTATVAQMGGLGLLQPNFPMSGSYAVADNNLTLSDGSHDYAYPFCVAASTLTVSQPTMAKTGTYVGTVVLQKQ